MICKSLGISDNNLMRIINSVIYSINVNIATNEMYTGNQHR